MPILDDIPAQQKLDQANVYDSALNLAKQGPHAWEDTQALTVPESYQQLDNLVMTGMGGSGLAARVIESAFFEQLKLPLTRINGYRLPQWVNEKTLVICSSYSGNTEETVQSTQQAIDQKAKLLGICTGGKLEELLKTNQTPFYKINPTYNPSNQPRMAIGYSIIGQLILASKAGVIEFTKPLLDQLTQTMEQVSQPLTRETTTAQNSAKTMAQTIADKQVIFVAADHLTGALHVVKNQMNENSKHLAHRHDISELNHHLMEGLKFPESNSKNVIFFLVNSKLYSPRIQQRFELTQDVIKQNGLATVTWQAQAKDKISQVFELIQFGAFLNFYLSMIHNLNPAPIPWVDYFKKKLGQNL